MRTLALLVCSTLLVLAACGGFNQSVDDVSTFSIDLAGPDHSASMCPDFFDPLMSGMPCAPDGIACAHCPGACQFCAGFTCQNGKWTQFEAAPLPCG